MGQPPYETFRCCMLRLIRVKCVIGTTCFWSLVEDFNGIKFAWLCCQVHLPCFKSTLPNCEVQFTTHLGILSKGLYPFANSTLPNCKVQHQHVCFPSPQVHNVIWLFCQSAKSTSPCELPKWVSSCPTISGLSDWFFFSSLPKPLLPKIRLTLTLAPSTPFPSYFVSLFILIKLIWWLFEAWEEPFQKINQPS
jgi:hypothetical protein